MIKQRSLPVYQIIAEMKRSQEKTRVLQEVLIEHARQQEILETRYNILAQLAKEGIEFVSNTHFSDVLDDRWIKQRDDLVERASSQLPNESL